MRIARWSPIRIAVNVAPICAFSWMSRAAWPGKGVPDTQQHGPLVSIDEAETVTAQLLRPIRRTPLLRSPARNRVGPGGVGSLMDAPKCASRGRTELILGGGRRDSSAVVDRASTYGPRIPPACIPLLKNGGREEGARHLRLGEIDASAKRRSLGFTDTSIPRGPACVGT